MFSYTVQPGDEDLDGIVWGDNTLRLDANDEITGVDSGLDAVLVHEFPGSDNPFFRQRIDQRPRVIFGYTNKPPTRVDTAETFWAGDTITFTVEFNQTVTVTGHPRMRFDIDSGTGDEYATYQSGSGTNILTFTYTVLATDSDDRRHLHLRGPVHVRNRRLHRRRRQRPRSRQLHHPTATDTPARQSRRHAHQLGRWSKHCASDPELASVVETERHAMRTESERGATLMPGLTPPRPAWPRSFRPTDL